MTRRSPVAAMLLRRAVQVVPVAVLATFIVFGLLQLVPGDPAAILAGDYASAERIAQIRAQYGFDQPLLAQYGAWLLHAARGDFGTSLLSGQAVLPAIAEQMPNTLVVVAGALLLSLLVGVPLGILAATRAGSVVDGAVSTVASLGVAMPNFWLGMVLVTVFALDLGWLPATGSAPLFTDPLGAVRHAVLPAVAVSAGGVADVARQVRSALAEVLGAPFVRTLRAKGMGPGAIVWKHGLKNIGVTLATVVGLLVNAMLGATVVVEAVFAIPGLGSLVVKSAIGKDFPMVQGVVLVMVLIVIAVNLLVDMLYPLLDPRISR